MNVVLGTYLSLKRYKIAHTHWNVCYILDSGERSSDQAGFNVKYSIERSAEPSTEICYIPEELKHYSKR